MASLLRKCQTDRPDHWTICFGSQTSNLGGLRIHRYDPKDARIRADYFANWRVADVFAMAG